MESTVKHLLDLIHGIDAESQIEFISVSMIVAYLPNTPRINTFAVSLLAKYATVQFSMTTRQLELINIHDSN